MKLAVVTHGFPTDSNPMAANFLLPFLDEISKRGHKVYVLTPRMGKETPLVYSYQVKVFNWGSQTLLGQLKLWKPAHLFSLFRFLTMQRKALFDFDEREGFDHTLVVWAIPNAIAARSLKKKRGTGYSTWSLGTDVSGFISNPFTRLLLRGLFESANHLFANSQDLCSKIEGISGRKAVYLPTYRPLETPPQGLLPDLDKETYHFLCVARLEPVKGPDILLRAFANFITKIPPSKRVKLHYLGSGSMKEELKKLADEMSLGDSVIFHGSVPPMQVAAFLRVVDCLVLPSRSESMPVAFWEAQSAGIPVIGTDVGDLGRAIREFGQGIVVKAGAVEELTEAMVKALKEGKAILKPNKSVVPPDPKQAALTFLEILGCELDNK